MHGTDGVLVIYTGGTVGAVHRHRENLADPLVPGSADELRAHLPLVDGRFLRFGRHAVPVTITATERLLDSTNVTPDDWQAVAAVVEANYDAYEGFVVLHGTDTMAFTASALAFMFENLAKPVILTGSQRPIGETRSDALQNIITAVELAAAASLGTVVVPEVCVFFHDVLLRGCRVTKTSASAYHGFHTPNCPPLAVAGEYVEVDETVVRPAGEGPFTVRYGLNRNIAVLQLSPLMSNPMLARILSADDLRAVVLETYGVGNAPSNGEFLDIIEGTVRRGVEVVAVTQCRQGAVELGLYQVSAGLLQRGVVSGLDMTAEAAQTKLAVLLEDEGRVDAAATLMQVCLRGEQSQSLFDLPFPGATAAPKATVVQTGSFAAASFFDRSRISRAQLRLLGVTVGGRCGGGPVAARVALNGGRGQPVAIEPDGGDGMVLLDVSAQVRRSLDPGRKTSLVVEIEGAERLTWQSMHLAVFTEA